MFAEALVPLTMLNTNFPMLPVPLTGVLFVVITSANVNFPEVDLSVKRFMCEAGLFPKIELAGSGGRILTFVIRFGS